MFIKVKLQKSDGLSYIDKYRVTTNAHVMLQKIILKYENFDVIMKSWILDIKILVFLDRNIEMLRLLHKA